MIETIYNEFKVISFNKYGRYIEDEDKKIIVNFYVEYCVEDLPLKIKDFIEMLKRENIISFWILCASIYKHLDGYVDKRYFDMDKISKITFKQYYMEIDKFKIFYDAIFDFGEARRW